MKIFLLLLMLLAGSITYGQAIEEAKIPSDWQVIKARHFEIYFPPNQGQEAPRAVLQKAENYYNAIADRIGYARYQNFWTWDARVKIVLYDDQASYVQYTGQPLWSRGFVICHLLGYTYRAIVSFKGQDNFVDTVLPHEIGHLILHDFIGAGRAIPVWFDEGVAQLEEIRNDDVQKPIMAKLIAAGKTIPVSLLGNYPALANRDAMTVEIFYAESLYIVDFLVKTYGKDAFARVCRNLRDGRSLEDAFKSAYSGSFESMDALQAAWFKYMITGFLH